STPTPEPSRPPLAGDLTGGVPVRLGGEGHWTIAGSRVFVGTDDGLVEARDLATGEVVWQAGFRDTGDAWDNPPTVATSPQGAVLGLRTVTEDGVHRLQLLTLDPDTGNTVDDRLLADPRGLWRVDLPPRILSADADDLVVAENPEWGVQTAVVSLPDGAIAWRVDEQGLAADAERVVTRTGARSRADGARLWEPGFALGGVLGEARDSLVVVDGAEDAAWLDRATGAELSRAPLTGEDSSCAATDVVLTCLTAEGATGYDLDTGDRLWGRAGAWQAVTGYDRWAYLWTGAGKGDVVQASDGELAAAGADLVRIVYGNADGVLVDQDGTAWVPARR
ncbi:MAG: PQQ-binding-like beta-propeller repeat protein, partial [Propionicimonas sp.]|nr:PQQ-binding-like beta-propeller repeat protein [Propionicimonas sp.]